MRILYLHQYFRTLDMAGGTRSFEMARRLVEEGHNVHIITSDTRAGGSVKITDESGVQVTWIPVAYANHMSYARRIVAFVEFAVKATWEAKKGRYDVVFASSTPLTIAIPGVVASKWHGVPMVFEVRDLWPEMPIAMGALKNPLMRWGARRLERWAYSSAARIVALSPGMKQGIVNTGYPAEAVEVIPNGCDAELFEFGHIRRVMARGRWDWLREGQPLVVYAGTLGAVNDVGYLVELAHEMAKIDSDVKFLIVGSGKEEGEIRRRANDLGVLGLNLYMMKEVAKADIPEILAAADVVVSLFMDIPEMRANSANKFFDALAAGKPIAINYGGWQAELIEENEVGIRLDPVNIMTAATDLAQFVHNDARLRRAGENSRALGRRFDRDVLAKQLSTLLSAVVART